MLNVIDLMMIFNHSQAVMANRSIRGALKIQTTEEQPFRISVTRTYGPIAWNHGKLGVVAAISLPASDNIRDCWAMCHSFS